VKKVKSFFTIGVKLFRIPHHLLVSLGVYLSIIPIAFLNIDSLFHMQSIVPSRPRSCNIFFGNQRRWRLLNLPTRA